MSEHPKTSNKVVVICIIYASTSTFAERKIMGEKKPRKPSQGESRDDLLSMWFRITRSEAAYVPSSQCHFLCFSFTSEILITNHPLATCLFRYTHKKVDVLISGIFCIDISHWNSNREKLRNNISSQEKQWFVMVILQSVLSMQRSHKEKLCLMDQSDLAVNSPEPSAWVAFKELHCTYEVWAKSFGTGEIQKFHAYVILMSVLFP